MNNLNKWGLTLLMVGIYLTIGLTFLQLSLSYCLTDQQLISSGLENHIIEDYNCGLGDATSAWFFFVGVIFLACCVIMWGSE
jgi:hypothetical protein